MPVLAHTECFEAAEIQRCFFPFSRPDYIEGMIIGDDLDSLLSAMYLQMHFGWPVKGVYCQYTKLYGAEPAPEFAEKLRSGRYIAVDLDINVATVPCIGHHIIALDESDDLPGLTHSLNPNAIRGFTVSKHFTRKYPLSTIHFLTHILETTPLKDKTRMAIWLADSSYINAQHYTANVEEWVRGRFQQYEPDLARLQTPEFEHLMNNLVLTSMTENQLCKPSPSKYRSKHLGLNGFQCQYSNPVHQQLDIQHLLIKLSRITGWPPLDFPRRFPALFTGQRSDQAVHTLRPFDTWLASRDVFSYAFTYKTTVNFTQKLL